MLEYVVDIVLMPTSKVLFIGKKNHQNRLCIYNPSLFSYSFACVLCSLVDHFHRSIIESYNVIDLVPIVIH